MDILIVEDDELDFLAIQRQLKRALPDSELHIVWINEPETTGLKEIIDAFDVCFLDQNLGVVSGIELIRTLSEFGTLTPMILLTGADDPEIDRKAAEYGACDYLVKGKITTDMLTRSIRYCRARKEQERKLAEMAFHDPMTGLANRAGFDRRLNSALKDIDNETTFLAFFSVDLDDFKAINDTYGHMAGDTVLRTIGDRLKGCVRNEDLVARLGGDEFGVLSTIRNADTGPQIIAENIKSVFERPIRAAERIIHCQASIGISVFGMDEVDQSASEFLRQADINLYAAKRHRKMRRDGITPRMVRQKPDAGSIANALALAVDRNEFHLVYQPKMRNGDRTISSAEALLRWNHPDMTVDPGVFIPLAEQYGSIHEIGRWVLEEACRQQRAWMDAGLSTVPIAVNVSPYQIETAEFERQLSEYLTQYHLSPDALELEITEAALMRGLEDRMDCLHRIADLGCKWVIDDFGVGHSSLSRLQNLPVSKLKLDRSFLNPLPEDESVANICNMVINLSRTLDLDLVVEGVENRHQIAMLDLRDDDELQGYYFHRPMPAEDFTNLLVQQTPAALRRAFGTGPMLAHFN